jgi:hypothetical protein
LTRQVPGAIDKAARDGRKHLMRVPITNTGTIPHEVEAWYCGSMVRLIPASPGTGIIACPSVRAVCEMSGIEPAGAGFYIVKGAGLPRIDIIGSQGRVNWNQLMSSIPKDFSTATVK